MNFLAILEASRELLVGPRTERCKEVAAFSFFATLVGGLALDVFLFSITKLVSKSLINGTSTLLGIISILTSLAWAYFSLDDYPLLVAKVVQRKCEVLRCRTDLQCAAAQKGSSSLKSLCTAL